MVLKGIHTILDILEFMPLDMLPISDISILERFEATNYVLSEVSITWMPKNESRRGGALMLECLALKGKVWVV